jgi:ubiquinone/menaquinone biosynthesis C-methylase UbiE
MSFMNDLRPETIERLSGEVLEVGFGTGLNLAYYTREITSLSALDPLGTGPLEERIRSRIASVPFPVHRFPLPADRRLPFEDARFDCVVTTWTLCSIDDPGEALAEMRRVLKPGGKYLFVEHGRSDEPSVARWQDRLNPAWRRLADGCNMNRAIDRLVRDSGFQLEELDRFRNKGPRVLSEMYRGVAHPAR